jgi:hypothetical protein
MIFIFDSNEARDDQAFIRMHRALPRRFARSGVIHTKFVNVKWLFLGWPVCNLQLHRSVRSACKRTISESRCLTNPIFLNRVRWFVHVAARL